MTECQVCVSKYNKGKNTRTECPYCKYECCRECLKTYLLSTVRDPHCMNCKRVLSRDILVTFLPKTWLSRELKEHREHVLLEREKSMLPATQPYLDKAIQLEQFDKQLLKKLEEVNKMREKVRQLEIEHAQIERQRYRLSMRDPMAQEPAEAGAAAAAEDEIKVERRTTVRQCPKDGCRGFLSTRYKCGVCETWVCSRCNKIKKEDRDMEHTCKEEDIKTVEYLRSQTKGCPKCGVSIEKISGCDQMWCQHEDTMIWLWSGEKKRAKEICVGDVLIGDDGTPRRVDNLTYGEADMYEIEQKFGQSYKVIGEHRLTLRNQDELTDISVHDYLHLSKRKKERGYYSAYTEGIRWSSQPVPLDPYLLGMWLGDPSSDNVGYPILESLDLINNKHIPDIYLHNDETKRLELLAGLIDGNKNGYGFSQATCWEKLCDQVQDLVHSLGLRSTRETSDKIHIRIVGNVEKIPVKLEYKNKITDVRNTIKVTPSGKGNYVGWSVSGGSPRYLLGDGTITHNCTHCHVAFSWSKGEIVHGAIHNPHYYEWLYSHQRAQAGAAAAAPAAGRNLDDLEREMCGQQFPHFDRIHEHLFLVLGTTDRNRNVANEYGYYLRNQDTRYQHPIYIRLRSIHRAINHVQHVEIPHYRPPERIDHIGIDLRVRYMMNRIEEEEWKRKLQMMEKKREKERDIFFVLEMVVNTAGDLIRNIMTFRTVEEIENYMKEFEVLRKYVNEQLWLIQKRYSNVVPIFRDDFQIQSSTHCTPE